MHLDGVALQRAVPAVEPGLDLRPRQHPRAGFQQQQQHREFTPRQRHRQTGALRRAGSGVDHQVSMLQQGLATAGGAAAQGPHAGGELVGVEGLGDVVVGTLVQRTDAGIAVVAGSHHQHGGVGVGQAAGRCGTQPCQQAGAVAVGQAQVEQQQVEGLGAQRRPARRQAGGGVHRMALAAQVGHQAIGNPAVVFQHQHTHGGIVRAAAAGPRRRLMPA